MPANDATNVIVLVFTKRTPTPRSFFYIRIRFAGIINKGKRSEVEKWRLKQSRSAKAFRASVGHRAEHRTAKYNKSRFHDKTAMEKLLN